MIVVRDRPPLWDRIDAQFHVAGKPILFAWGDRIFNPEGVKIPKELIAHEEIHGERQLNYTGAWPFEAKTAVECWWEEYLCFPSFRLAEEIPAHRAEYLNFCKRHGNQRLRNEVLTAIAGRLASPLYGSLVNTATARDLILRGEG